MPKKKPALAQFQILEEATVPIDTLVDDPDNANVHDEENQAQIQASLKTFKQVVRLVVRKSDRQVFDGNGRLEAMRRLAWKEARVQFIEGSDEACRAFSIAAQDTAKTSRWNKPLLAEHLQELSAVGLLELTTISLERYDAILEEVRPVEPGGGEPLPRGRGGALATCPKCGHSFQLGGKDDEKPKGRDE
jgi:ParB-like nuclease domain